MKKKDPLHEAKLLAKYRRLMWFDPDNTTVCYFDTNMEWIRGTGWCVLGVRADGGTDTWCIDLLPEMIGAYPQPREVNVEFVMNEKEGPSKRKRTDGSSSSSEEEDIYS